MPTIDYRNARGDKVPGTTTVISQNLGWNKGQLMWWANQEGLAGRKHTESSGKAATVGTLAHALVEAHITDTAPPEAPADLMEKAVKAFDAYRTWERHSRLVIVATEINLVSERFQYGATPDAIGLIDAQLVLLDWKTSNGTYADHLIQLAAYRHAFEEVTGLTLAGGYHLCRFGKEAGNFTHHWWAADALEAGWQTFVKLRELHDMKRGLEALAK